MDKKRLTEALRSLAAGTENRSETARLRDVIESVEDAIAAGVSRVAILDALHREGFSMTLKTFDNALYRIRKKRGGTAEAMPRSGLRKPKERSEQSEGSGLHNPKMAAPAEPAPPSHKPDDLTKVMSANVDLAALSKFAKGKKR